MDGSYLKIHLCDNLDHPVFPNYRLPITAAGHLQMNDWIVVLSDRDPPSEWNRVLKGGCDTHTVPGQAKNVVSLD